jgi:hypothetical protein
VTVIGDQVNPAWITRHQGDFVEVARFDEQVGLFGHAAAFIGRIEKSRGSLTAGHGYALGEHVEEKVMGTGSEADRRDHAEQEVALSWFAVEIADEQSNHKNRKEQLDDDEQPTRSEEVSGR